MLVLYFFSPRALFLLTNKRLKRFMGHISNFEPESLYFVIIKEASISVSLKGPLSSSVLLWGAGPRAAHLQCCCECGWDHLSEAAGPGSGQGLRAGGFTLFTCDAFTFQSGSLGVLWMFTWNLCLLWLCYMFIFLHYCALEMKAISYKYSDQL